MYGIVRALCDYFPNARAKISHEVKSGILWIILLQSRRYAQEKMEGGKFAVERVGTVSDQLN